MALVNGRWGARHPSLLLHFLRALAPGLVLSAGLLAASPAHAQSASDKAAAEVLFDEGVRLLKEGKIEEACPKLEKSQSVDPGIGTLLYLGECYKKAGRTASAWATFREAASKADASGEQGRARTGKEKADEIEPTLSKLLLELDKANTVIDGLYVLQGGHQVNRALWGSAVPVDPGELVVRAEAPGYESFEVSITVQPGPSQSELRIPELVKLPETPVAPAPATSNEQSPALDANEEIVRPGTHQRTVGIVVGSIGVGGLALGGVFGTLAILAENKAKDQCDVDAGTCPPDGNGIQNTNRARSFAAVSTVGFIAGGALLATGAVLYYTAPSGSQTTVGLVPTPGGAHLSWGGTF